MCNQVGKDQKTDVDFDPYWQNTNYLQMLTGRHDLDGTGRR